MKKPARKPNDGQVCESGNAHNVYYVKTGINQDQLPIT